GMAPPPRQARRHLAGASFRLALVAAGLAVDEAAHLANEHFLTLRAGDFHVRLIGADVRLAAARLKGLVAVLTNQRLFTETALHLGPLRAVVKRLPARDRRHRPRLRKV